MVATAARRRQSKLNASVIRRSDDRRFRLRRHHRRRTIARQHEVRHDPSQSSRRHDRRARRDAAHQRPAVAHDHGGARQAPARLRPRGRTSPKPSSRRPAPSINEIGQRSNDTHNEAILMAGLARRVLARLPAQQRRQRRDRDHRNPARALLADGVRRASKTAARSCAPTPGKPLFVTGRVVDRAGRAGRRRRGRRLALPRRWVSTRTRIPSQADMNLRGKFTTDADGRFWLRTVKMIGYPMPARRRRRPICCARRTATPIGRRTCMP